MVLRVDSRACPPARSAQDPAAAPFRRASAMEREDDQLQRRRRPTLDCSIMDKSIAIATSGKRGSGGDGERIVVRQASGERPGSVCSERGAHSLTASRQPSSDDRGGSETEERAAAGVQDLGIGPWALGLGLEELALGSWSGRLGRRAHEGGPCLGASRRCFLSHAASPGQLPPSRGASSWA